MSDNAWSWAKIIWFQIEKHGRYLALLFLFFYFYSLEKDSRKLLAMQVDRQERFMERELSELNSQMATLTAEIERLKAASGK